MSTGCFSEDINLIMLENVCVCYVCIFGMLRIFEHFNMFVIVSRIGACPHGGFARALVQDPCHHQWCHRRHFCCVQGSWLLTSWGTLEFIVGARSFCFALRGFVIFLIVCVFGYIYISYYLVCLPFVIWLRPLVLGQVCVVVLCICVWARWFSL